MKTIKSKIFVGVAFLFAVILVLSFIGIVFINRLAQASRGTIVDNYTTVDYTMNMLRSLADLHAQHLQIIANRTGTGFDSLAEASYQRHLEVFEKNLQLEANNLTEPGEVDLVHELQSNYRAYLNTFEKLHTGNAPTHNSGQEALEPLYLNVRATIEAIYRLNRDAILNKNSRAQQTAARVTSYMFVVAVASILATFSFVFTFPARIVKPITALTEKIKAISERHYDQQLEVNSRDEIGALAGAFNVMATRLKEYEVKHIDQILLEKKRMESLVQSLQDGVLVLDHDKKVVLANGTLLELTNLTAKDFESQYVPDLAARNDLIRTMIQPVMHADEEWSSNDGEPIRIVRHDQELFFKVETIAIRGFSETSQQEKVIGHLILLKNVTQYRLRDVAKTNLIATASHELKTPLSSINLSLKLLEDTRLGSLNEEQKNVVQSLRQQSNRLNRVVNELLNYSQIETGNIKLQIATVRPADVLDLAVTALLVLISEKKIQIETQMDEPLPDIQADLEKTVWVLVNLLSNAIRYSKEHDTITLSVTAQSAGVCFSVRDHGPGIPQGDQKKLFQRYVQVGQKLRQGWGLGLAISREFVQAQGGRIWVESEVGQGSAFSFVLPRT